MKKILSTVLAAWLTLTSFEAQADYCFPTYNETVGAETFIPSKVNYFTLSGIFGKAQMKQGTVKQDGWLYGARGNFDIISPGTLYLGVESGYKYGNLTGKGIPIPPSIIIPATKSQYSDFWGELRAGFTVGTTLNTSAIISPYFVLGYEKETDDFVSPSPILLTHRLAYGYLGCGAVSSFYINPAMSIGLNGKLKWLFNAKSKIGGDPEITDKNISCAGCFHWFIEMPFTYWISPNLSLALAPSYEYKNYDKHKFGFTGSEKATFHMWGGTIQLGYAY